MKLRPYVKLAWVTFLSTIGAFDWARRRLAAQGAIVVLMFHRVLGDDDFDRTNSLPGMVMRATTFDALLAHAQKRAELLSPYAKPGPRHAKPGLVLTFDDGWLDNATVAFPIARARNAPFVIFICPALMNAHEPFWTERAVAHSGGSRQQANGLIESLKHATPSVRDARLSDLSSQPRRPAAAIDRTMSWTDVRQLHTHGVTFGSHSNAHEILTHLAGDELSQDLSAARRVMEQELEENCALFAYPNGGTNNGVAAAVAATGHELAFTTERRAWFPGEDPYHVPRVNMWEGKVASPAGEFSGAAFDYAAFWRPFLVWVAAARGVGRVARFLGWQ
jgi:peptidoglycan/xylan/chitin deacetylase (PgdA/CDA1 family)